MKSTTDSPHSKKAKTGSKDGDKMDTSPSVGLTPPSLKRAASKKILENWQDELLVEVFLVSINRLRVVSPVPGREITHMENLAEELEAGGKSALEGGFFDRIVMEQFLSEKIQKQPVAYLIECFRRAVAAGKSSTPKKVEGDRNAALR